MGVNGAQDDINLNIYVFRYGNLDRIISTATANCLIEHGGGIICLGDQIAGVFRHKA